MSNGLKVKELTELAHELTCTCMSNAKTALHRNFDKKEIEALSEDYKIEVLKCEQQNLSTVILIRMMEECTDRICNSLNFIADACSTKK